jgi:hypothetical protein
MPDSQAIAELLIDDTMIEMSAGVKRKIHSPVHHRLNPLVVPDKWHEGMITSAKSVLYDPEDKLFKMWYMCGTILEKQRIDNNELYTAYAVSDDGINWRKPEPGVVELAGRRDHNIVLLPERDNEKAYLGFTGRKRWLDSVILNPKPHSRDDKFVAVGFDQGWRGSYLAFSPDGINWRMEEKPFWRTPVDASGWGDDNLQCLAYDQIADKWRLYRRLSYQESERLFAAPGDENWKMPDRCMRIMGYADSDDLRDWNNHRIILYPDGNDDPDVEFYGMTCSRYGSGHVGFLWVYHMAPEKEYIDIELISSRDGMNFDRCCRHQPFIANGPDGSYNHEILTASQNELITVDDEIYLYYVGCNYKHTGEALRRSYSRQTTSLATLPRDRFVSFETGYPQPCRLVTKPFKLEPAHLNLYLNAATWGEGFIQVEILSRDWKVLSGFSSAESLPFRGNNLAQRAVWKNKQNLSELAGREIRIKFDMADARIHAFYLNDKDMKPKAMPDLQMPHTHRACPAV